MIIAITTATAAKTNAFFICYLLINEQDLPSAQGFEPERGVEIKLMAPLRPPPDYLHSQKLK
jgi:hypothetical protein